MKLKLEPGVMPKRPYRDSALLYGGFAVVFLVVVFATGGRLLVAVPIAAGCFVLATAYSWWRIRERLEAEEQDS
jgi:ABC-type bacteriocin/lantibiotic exporter with double-glycine peptidase domain